MLHREPRTLPEAPAAGFPSPALFLGDLRAGTREEALSEMVDAAAAARAVEAPKEVLRILLDREILGSTGVGKGVAIPHARSLAVPKPLVAFARSQRGVGWEAPDGEDVRLIFLLLAPDVARWRKPYLEHLARLARAVAAAQSRRRLLLAPDLQTVQAILTS